MNSLNPYWIIFLTAVVALVPLLVGLVTAYVKVSIVFGMVKSALGTQQVPSALVVMAVSLAVTLFIMSPVIDKTVEIANGLNFKMVLDQPSAESISQLKPLLTPWREFMIKHSGSREILLLAGLAKNDVKAGTTTTPAVAAEEGTVNPNDVSLRILIPAFMLTEMKEAFSMGFVLLLPFLVIDLVVANVLVGLGMYMVSPVMIALPLKLILFVVTDGWLLLVKGLITSYQLVG